METKKDSRCWCKACMKIYQRNYQRIYYKARRKAIISRTSAHKQTPTGKIMHNESRIRHCLKYPEKVKARRDTNNAIHNGIIRRSVFCEGCGLPAVTQAHHEDYNKPLKVDWLCNDCHSRIHTR